MVDEAYLDPRFCFGESAINSEPPLLDVGCFSKVAPNFIFPPDTAVPLLLGVTYVIGCEMVFAVASPNRVPRDSDRTSALSSEATTSRLAHPDLMSILLKLQRFIHLALAARNCSVLGMKALVVSAYVSQR